MNMKDLTDGCCRVCSSANIVYLCDTYNEHSETTAIRNYRCNECGSVFVGNDIDRKELGIAYSTLDSKKYYEEIESENRRKMATAIGNLKEILSKRDTIIDIGTGNGLFVELLSNAGFEDVSAHEIEGSDLSRIKRIASCVYQDFDYASIPSNKFDAVTLLDVVEHVIDPKYLINMCARILRKDGVIYFHTPVVTRTDRLMHSFQKVPVLRKAGTIWQRGRTSIFHLENYTPKSLTLLLEKCGFYDIKIEVKNELSWPVTNYIRTYLLDKQGLPGFIAPILVPLFYPLLATDFFNANKAIVSARKANNS
jgi:2-polyprenyl-3-methyl-5-hydroxy-6-metoxy-1,4-benzoquinol methylase